MLSVFEGFMNRIYLVLSMFTDSLLALNQSLRFVSSVFTVEKTNFKLDPEKKILVSSAKRTKLKNLEDKWMSLIYKRNSRGPSIEPCGTPQLITSNYVQVKSYDTHCLRFCR